jgi:predicted methyltransferase
MITWASLAGAAALIGWFGYRTMATRQVAGETARLAALLGLEPDAHVADVGAGAGAFTIAFASTIVPRGQLLATEIDEKAVASLRAKAIAAGLRNVTVVQARADTTSLPRACCDAAFLRGVYHHITRPAETGISLFDALRPGGRLAIIDFEPSWFLSTFFPVRDVPQNRGGHGIPPAVVVAEVEAAGLRLLERHDDWTRGHYCLVFERP